MGINNRKRNLNMSLNAFENLKRKKRREELGLGSEDDFEPEEESEEVVLEEIVIFDFHH